MAAARTLEPSLRAVTFETLIGLLAATELVLHRGDALRRRSWVELAAPIVGGLGTLFGPILGAFIIVPINEWSRDLAQSSGINGLNLLIYGLLLMTVIKLSPGGCWPKARSIPPSCRCGFAFARKAAPPAPAMMALRPRSRAVAA